MSDPIQDLQKQIDTLWKELTTVQSQTPPPSFNYPDIVLPIQAEAQGGFIYPSRPFIKGYNQPTHFKFEPTIRGIIHTGALDQLGNVVNLVYPGHDGMIADLHATKTDTLLQSRVNSDPTGRLSNHPFDRTALEIDKVSYQANLAPHAVAQRWTYTVPASKILYAFARVKCFQTALATAGGAAESFVQGPGGIDIARATILTNTAGTRLIDREVSSPFYLFAGDTISASDDDTSTNGTVTYEADLLGFQFDV